MADVLPLQNQPPVAEPEIYVIPDKFYGAALRAKVPDMADPSAGLDHPPAKRGLGLIVVAVLVFLLAGGGAVVYVERDVLFKKAVPVTPAAPVEQPAPVVATPPTAPGNLNATSTNPQSASVSWTDTASDESGFRIERAVVGAGFVALSNLPPNSTNFVDSTVQAGTTYRYHVIALNAGGESQPSAESTAIVASLPPPPPEPPKLPPAGLDSDSDGMTDAEEMLLHSDAHNPDSDGDGFLDGNETFNLYNPNLVPPSRLIDAGLTKAVFGTIGWEMQIPTDWKLVEEATDGSKAKITTGGSESFTVTVEDNGKLVPILDWYVSRHPETKPSQVLKYRSKKGYVGIIAGTDLLSTYISWGDKVLAFHYDLGGQPFINYHTLYSMMLNSLVLKGVAQVNSTTLSGPLPFEPAATTTGVIAQPEAVTTTVPVTPTP